MYTSTLASRERTNTSRSTLRFTSIRKFASSGDWEGKSSRSAITAVSSTLNSAGSPAPTRFLLSDGGMYNTPARTRTSPVTCASLYGPFIASRALTVNRPCSLCSTSALFVTSRRSKLGAVSDFRPMPPVNRMWPLLLAATESITTVSPNIRTEASIWLSVIPTSAALPR